MEFEWDPNKVAKNLKKHKVSFHEAATVLGDPLSTTFPDPGRSTEESRYITIELSNHRRLLIVAHTDRNDCTRVINARETTHKERKFYEEESAG